MTWSQLSDSVWIVDSQYVQQQFAGVYCLIHDDEIAIIDTGTSHSVRHILNAMSQNGFSPQQVRYIVLTHIHLDHAGGAGWLMQACPNAKLLVHARGQKHMIDPSKLIASAQSVYGEARFTELYGDIAPIAASRVLPWTNEMIVPLGKAHLQCIESLGHANHHMVVHDLHHHCIFTGDTFGIAYPKLQSLGHPFIFPSTTPTQFNPKALQLSIERIIDLKPQQVFLTHFGGVSEIALLGNRLIEWIDHWTALASQYVDEASLTQAIQEWLWDHWDVKTLSKIDFMNFIQLDANLNAQGLLHWRSTEMAPN